MHFQNECECIVDYEMLATAIEKRCNEKEKRIKTEYKIVLHNSYPTICIAHDHVYVHNLIGELKYGSIPCGYVIHHNDHNKKNNDFDNLILLTNVEHALIHGKQRKGIDLRSEEGKWNGINAAREKRFRHEIRKEDIEIMMKDGVSKTDIARYFRCGVNTIYRRLGYNH